MSGASPRSRGDLAHRTLTRKVVVTDASGAPLAGVPVTVEQVRHAFGFGNIGFDFVGLANGETGENRSMFGGASVETAQRIADLWFELYNQVTLPFYWRGFEPERGKPDTVRLQNTARWFQERGVAIKGHPLVWHTLAPQWLLPLSDDAVERLIVERVTRDVTDFRGLVDHWDALNEAVILPRFVAEENAVTRLAQKLGRAGIGHLAFDTARAANPDVKLVLNDFILDDEYVRVIEEFLEAGIRIDAIGLQTHMHQGFRGEDELGEILERFEVFGLPLQFTETTLVSGHLMPEHIVDLNDYQIPDWPTTPEGEERQADEMVRHYRTVAAHPLVESVTYWGIADEGSWLGAPAGLIRRDGTPKPSFYALRDLVKGEWWVSPTELVTDDDGAVEISGWAGAYAVSARGSRAEFEVSASADAPATVVL
ncbi:MAG: endo-1,4-beta-xylanase [Actinomycetes bacterium]|nr:MAG: 1,4-beta-xylanase [Actinomycetota bacterium]